MPEQTGFALDTMPYEAVISTEHQGSRPSGRPSASGEIPMMRPLPCRYGAFSPEIWDGNAVLGKELGENSLNRHGGTHILGVSPLAFSRFAPSHSVEMTGYAALLQIRSIVAQINRGT